MCSGCYANYWQTKEFVQRCVAVLVRARRDLSEGLKDGLMDRRFFLTIFFCSVLWILFWEVRWKKRKESQIEEWLQVHSLSQYSHLFE
ncbi:hypothetical protein AMECASPLE_020732, partial [Ameca splendens]